MHIKEYIYVCDLWLLAWSCLYSALLHTHNQRFKLNNCELHLFLQCALSPVSSLCYLHIGTTSFPFCKEYISVNVTKCRCDFCAVFLDAVQKTPESCTLKFVSHCRKSITKRAHLSLGISHEEELEGSGCRIYISTTNKFLEFLPPSLFWIIIRPLRFLTSFTYKNCSLSPCFVCD